MGLKEFLAAGLSVPGSKYDGRVKDLCAMSDTTLRRNGLMNADRTLTEKGENRLTSNDRFYLDFRTKYAPPLAKTSKSKR